MRYKKLISIWLLISFITLQYSINIFAYGFKNTNDFSFNKKIYINTTESGVYIDEDIEDFPLLIRLNELNFSFTNVKDEGLDIMFRDMDGKDLNFEFEYWNKEDKKAEIWVLMPLIKKDSDEQYIEILWGKDDFTNSSNSENVFEVENNFLGVWHLNDNSNNTYIDSTANNLDLTGENMSDSSSIRGFIGNGQSFTGNNYIKSGDYDSLKLDKDMTVSFWMNTEELSKDWVRLVGKGDSKKRNYGIWLNKSNKKILFQQYNDKGRARLNLTSTYSTELNKWHHITAKIEKNEAKIYIDGVENGSSKINGNPANSDDFMTIAYAGFHTYYKGIVDEVRISDKSRNENWIKLEYESQKENQSLIEIEILPQVISTKISKDNSYIDLEFNQGLYSDEELKDGVSKDDFTLLFNQNGGDCDNVSIDKITSLDNELLVGGENSLRIHLDVSDYPSGVETIEIKPDENSVFNENSVPMNILEGTGLLELNLQIEDIVIDNNDSDFSVNGKWIESIIVKGYFAENYIHDGTSSINGSDFWAKWSPNIKKEGRYKVYMRWTSASNRPDDARVDISFDGGIDSVKINQKQNGGKWNLLGTYSFGGSDDNYVKLNTNDDGYTIADAIRIEYVGSSYNKWKYRSNIYFDTTDEGANVKEDVSNFPVLIKLNNENFNFNQAKLNGEDIRFSDNDGNEFDYEIESWDYTLKSANIWVLVPKIYGENKTQNIKMYWGNSESTDNSNGTAVFSKENGFEGVWHLDEEGNSDEDGYLESVQGRNAKGINMDSTNDIYGISGKGQNLNGSDNFIEINNSDIYKITGNITISFWMNTNSNARDWVRLVGKGNSTKRNYGVWLNRSNNKILFQQYNSTGKGVLNLYSLNSTVNGQWTHVTCTINNNKAKIYLNGTADSNGNRSGEPGTSGDNLSFGYAGFHTYYNGMMDEVRISTVERDSNWVELEYENQKENQSLVVFPKKPIISDYKLAENNSYVELEFSTGVYGDINKKTPIDIDDFNLIFHSNGGSEIETEISEVTNMSDSGLVGGETKIKIFMNIYDTPTGVESIEIRAKGSNSIYNDYGLAMDWGQTTGKILLNVVKSSTIIIDNTDSEFVSSGKWTESVVVKEYYGKNYIHDSTYGTDDSSKWGKWIPDINYSGEYEVYMRWSSGGNRPDMVPLEIKYKDGIDNSRIINQQKNGGQWNYIGKYDFSKGNENYIKILTSDRGYTIADAVKLVYIGSSYEDWDYNTRIYIDTSSSGADISEDVEKFPVLVELNEENFNFERANSDGNDIRFSDSSGISLKYEIESWNKDKKEANIWVLVPYINGSNNSQFIRMYWGNIDAKSESNGEAVFDKEENYQGVWHLNEEGNSTLNGYKDSSINSNDLTGISMDSSSDVEGKISNAQKFDGSKDYINGANDDSLKIKGDMTISFWMNTDSMSKDWVRLVGKGNSTKRNYGVWLNRSNKKILFQQYGSSGNMSFYSNSATSTDKWHYVSTTIENNIAKIYIDGKLDSTNKRKGSPYTSDDTFSLAYAGFHTYYNGILDEVRIMDSGKSDSWIKMEYENQKENQTLIKIETRPSIIEYDLAYNNEYVDIKFSQGVFATSLMKGGLEKGDFELVSSNKNLDINIESVKSIMNKELKGGETDVRIYLNIEGEINENDVFFIKPSNNSAIFNEKGIAMLGDERTEDIILNLIGDESDFDSWKYNTKIILDTTSKGANIENDVKNIPILIELNENNFELNFCKEDGSDLRFTNGLGIELNYEIENWDIENNKASIWVLVPIVKSKNDNQFIKMYWGNESANSKSDGESIFNDEIKSEDFIKLSYENQKENQTFVNVMPVILNIESSTGDGQYKIGDKINLNINLSGKFVLENDDFYIKLNSKDDSKAIFKNQNGKVLYFEYTVLEGDLSDNLDLEQEEFIIYEADTFKSLNGFNFNLELPKLNSFSESSLMEIDGIKPIIENIVINDGESVVDNNKINLKIEASDNGSGLESISISENKSDYNWVDFNKDLNYELSKENGSKILYISVKDKAGNISLKSSRNINVKIKFFKVLDHIVRTKDNNIFEVGGIVPISLKVLIESDIKNPTFTIDLNTKDSNGNKLGFYLMPYAKENGETDKSRIKFIKSDEIMSNNLISVNSKEESLNSKKYNITLEDSFSKGEIIEIQYLTKLNADSKVLQTGILNYLKNYNIVSKEIYIDFEISKWFYDTNKVGTKYYKQSDVLANGEKDMFSASLIIEPVDIIK
jgi:hypothetical protein